MQIPQNEPLKLAVVGHTNTGKTSILRTLLRDVYFGETKNAAATTRHVEKALIKDTQTEESLIALFDTPGLEDASGVMDWLETNTSSRRDGIERLKIFLASDLAKSKSEIQQQKDNSTKNAPFILETQDNVAAHSELDSDFSQEAKVIKQLLASDMAIYVIDARESILGKYKDELSILSWAAVPVMPVFNFTNYKNSHIQEWQEMLARRNLHITTLFDSIAFEFDDEMKLWQNLATMSTRENKDSILNQLIANREFNWQMKHEDATLIIADFLINIASFVKEVDEEEDPLPTLESMKQAVRQAERDLHQELLNLYKFYDSEVLQRPLNISEYQQDPFDIDVLKSYGIRTSSGAAAGALVGMGIDAAALGTTLGLGTAIGSLMGGILSNTNKIHEIITGTKRLYIDPDTLTLLAVRANILHKQLRQRGHAENNKLINPAKHSSEQDYITSDIELSGTIGKVNNIESPKSETMPLELLIPWKSETLPKVLKKARNKPECSSLSGTAIDTAKLLREDMAWELARLIS